MHADVKPPLLLYALFFLPRSDWLERFNLPRLATRSDRWDRFERRIDWIFSQSNISNVTSVMLQLATYWLTLSESWLQQIDSRFWSHFRSPWFSVFLVPSGSLVSRSDHPRRRLDTLGALRCPRGGPLPVRSPVAPWEGDGARRRRRHGACSRGIKTVKLIL